MKKILFLLTILAFNSVEIQSCESKECKEAIAAAKTIIESKAFTDLNADKKKVILDFLILTANNASFSETNKLLENNMPFGDDALGLLDKFYQLHEKYRNKKITLEIATLIYEQIKNSLNGSEIVDYSLKLSGF